MAKKIYLNGGADIRKGESERIDSMALANADNKNVLVLNLTTNDEQKIIEYKNFLDTYFRKIGATNVSFITDLNLGEINNQFQISGLVYIPGGDTSLLMENIKNKKLDNVLKNFKGVLVGNSAGTMILCKEGFCMGYNGRESKIKGIGLVDFLVDVHYNKTHDEKLKLLSSSTDLYAIPEASVVVVEKSKESFIGDIYKFSKGEKTKIN